MTGLGRDGAGAAHQELLDRLLAGRSERTRKAYANDLMAFARFRGRPPAEALAELLAGGPLDGRRLLLDYVIHLRRTGSAPATVARRLSTLRALSRLAGDAGLLEWSLEAPDEDEISWAMDQLALGNVPYLLPRHAGEIDRLDLQHYALRAALGTNHLAPVAAPRLVLDAGAGTGQWGFEICEQFPEAHVVGLDLVPGKPGHPPRYHPVRANLLHGLPFTDDRFDYVHQRLLFLGVPLGAWPAVVRDLVRVTRPGGWVELVEPPTMAFDRTGPAIERLRTLLLGAAAARGLDATGELFSSLDRYLRDAGAAQVVRREVSLPVGEWGGRVGSLMSTDFRVAFTMFCQVLATAGTISADESSSLLRRVQEEYEELHVSTSIAIAYGRKP